MKEDHARMATVLNTIQGMFQFPCFSFCQSSRLQDMSSGVTSSIGIGVGYKVSGSQCVTSTIKQSTIFDG